MPITIQHRRVAGIAVIACTGRIVDGPEAEELRQTIDRLLEFGSHLILNVAGVDFVDSCGLGLLVRYTMRVRNAYGVLKLCGVTPQLERILTGTKLDGVFETHATEEEAIGAFFERRHADAERPTSSDVLCVIASVDVQALVREMLTRGGFGVLSTGNLPDGLILLRATHPKLVIIDRALRKGRQTDAAVKFGALTANTLVIELEEDFAQRDPVDAVNVLRDRMRAAGAVF
jgi:stage II sporulation protein AA (anti-sigma F factor antagonist)